MREGTVGYQNITMSDTPRTDEVFDAFGATPHPSAMAYFSLCRELERENAQLRSLLGAALEDSERWRWVRSENLVELLGLDYAIAAARKQQEDKP